MSGDWADERAREWLDCDEGMIPTTVASLAALLREVAAMGWEAPQPGVLLAELGDREYACDEHEKEDGMFCDLCTLRAAIAAARGGE